MRGSTGPIWCCWAAAGITRSPAKGTAGCTARWMQCEPSTSGSQVLRIAAVIAQTHHERWDGTGYPIGLVGEDIPIEGRITAVADVYDALSRTRPYKEAFSPEKCLELLEEGRGTHFDPRVLEAFFDSYADIVRVSTEFADPY